MTARLEQVCLFKINGTTLKRFCDVVSGQVDFDNGELLSYRMGQAKVAHHRPAGVLGEDDVLVTLQVDSVQEVDRIYASLLRAGVPVDDHPENTDWGWRVFYVQVAAHLYFEVMAPSGPA